MGGAFRADGGGACLTYKGEPATQATDKRDELRAAVIKGAGQSMFTKDLWQP